MLTLAAWMVSVTLDRAGSAVSMVASPAKSVNAPRTVVTMAWRAENPTRLWVTSRS